MRESDLDAEVRRLADLYDWQARKMNGSGHRSWPDWLIITHAQTHPLDYFFIENKRPAQILRRGQAYQISKLRNACQAIVFVCRSKEQIQAVFTAMHDYDSDRVESLIAHLAS